jgi:hypothetical protein
VVPPFDLTLIDFDRYGDLGGMHDRQSLRTIALSPEGREICGCGGRAADKMTELTFITRLRSPDFRAPPRFFLTPP